MLIVHLSDLHIKVAPRPISFDLVFEAIKHKIAAVKSIAIVVTGDIAYSGQDEEYKLFLQMINTLQQRIDAEFSGIELKLIVVPGNHDCDFDKSTEVRKIVVEKVKAKETAFEESIYATCTEVQENFFKMLAEINKEDIKYGSNRLCWQITFEDNELSVVFTAYNTSWLSILKEDPGSLYYPQEIFTAIDRKYPIENIRIGLYHHPDNWISPKHDEQNHREFRNHVMRYNNLVLSGHEHQENLREYNDLSNGSDCHFHESTAYHDGSTYVGFCTIDVEKNGNFVVEEYKYDNEKEYFRRENQIKDSIKDASSQNHHYEIKQEFKDYLSDTEVFVSDSNNKKLTLKEIYSYPKIENIETEEIIDSEQVLKDKDIEKLVIFGTDQSGKTALLKMVYSYWYYHGFTPILLDIKNDVKNDNIRQAIKNVYRKQYNEYKTSFDEYLSLGFDKKIILVDNFHSLGVKLDKDDILQKINNFSKKIVITCDDISSLEEMSLGKEENITFKKYTLLPFGHVGRESIIDKWLDGIHLQKEDFMQIKRKIHGQVNDIIGTNLVPSYPLFILTILQALNIGTPHNTEITSYGNCYQALIYFSFKRNGLKDDEFEMVDNFLSHLAHAMYERQTKYIATENCLKIYNQYSEKYIITKTFNELLEILNDANVIIEDSMGNICFKYVYIYYYYVAKYLSKFRLGEKGFIESLCEQLEKRENSFIILFITYHSDNQDVIEEIIYNTMNQFEDIDPITLVNSETDFMKNTAEFASSAVIEDVDPEEYRKKELAIKDKEEENKRIEPVDVNESLNKINKVFKSLEINGQLLKIRYGSIDKSRLESIIEESFLSCYRLLRFLVTDLSNEDTAILLAEQFEEYLKLNDKSLPSTLDRRELLLAIQKLISNITYYISHYTLDRTAQFLGNVKLIDLYQKVSEKINTPASKLTLMLIEFKFSKNIDKEKIESLKRDFKNNSFAFSILKKAAVNYIYMHTLTHQEKNWIASTLEIPITGQRRIENKKNR